MQQFLPCNGCGNQIPIPEQHQDVEGSEYLECVNCGNQIAWPMAVTELKEPASPPEFALELELDPAVSELEEAPPDATEPVPDETKPVETTLDWSVLGPAVPRRRQKEVSAFRKIVPPVLGGLAAFPIATLIMWYGFGRDIGSTGPTVAQYVPWIVPQKFHPRAWELPKRNFGDAARGSPPRSNSTSQNTLPSLNRDNPAIAIQASPKTTVDSPSVDIQPPIPEPVKTPAENQSKEIIPESTKPALSETIRELRALQLGWESTPVSERTDMLQNYCALIKQLSEQSSKLNGRSAGVWRKDLEKLAREILAHAKIPRAIELGASGKLTGVPPASSDGFVATIIKLGEDNDPKPNEPWSLRAAWPSDKGDIPVEVLAGAWRTGTTVLPANCLVLGQVAKSESSESEFILRVHLILAE